MRSILGSINFFEKLLTPEQSGFLEGIKVRRQKYFNKYLPSGMCSSAGASGTAT